MIQLALFQRLQGEQGPYALALYAVYTTVLLARKGRTLGHWLFDLEVVDLATGNRPRPSRAALRAVLPIAPLFLCILANYVLRFYRHEVHGSVLIAALVLVPLALIWASLRSHSKLTVWDKLSGTMVRYRTRRTTPI